MRAVWGGGVVVWMLVGSVEAAEVVKVIYRRSDGVVGAYCTPSNTQANCVADNLRAMPGSALGGTEADYAVLEVDQETWAQKEGGRKEARIHPQTHAVSFADFPGQESKEEPVDIPIEDFGAGAAGALAVLAGRGLVLRMRKKPA